MRKTYRAAMEWLYIVCISLSGVAMLIMTIIIPYGVFMRYWVESPASWPEPAGILLMVLFSFIGGGAAYPAQAPNAGSNPPHKLKENQRVPLPRTAHGRLAVIPP